PSPRLEPGTLCTHQQQSLTKHRYTSQYNPFPGITNKKFIDDCVRIHNDNRSSVNPPARNMLYMVSSEAMRAWPGQDTDFQHNIYLKEVRRVHLVFSSVGENIWAGYPPSTFSVMRAMDLWVREVNYYSCQSNVRVLYCSITVGCAVQISPNRVDRTSFSDKEGAIFVCNYAEATGWKNAAREGANNQCQAKLCRESVSYRWTPDWDPTLATCGPCCMAILAIRPLDLLLAFVAAFGVHRLYPTYEG
uniref:SCP domain-containing protein n=1 Tax=Salmo trutta TaxID=8032 RepID=A0A674EFL8_SALTR